MRRIHFPSSHTGNVYPTEGWRHLLSRKIPAHPSTWSDGKRGVRKKMCWCPPNYAKMLPHQCAHAAKNRFPALIVPLGSPGMGMLLPPCPPSSDPAFLCFPRRNSSLFCSQGRWQWEGVLPLVPTLPLFPGKEQQHKGEWSLSKSGLKGDDKQIQMWNFSARGRRVVTDYHNI